MRAMSDWKHQNASASSSSTRSNGESRSDMPCRCASAMDKKRRGHECSAADTQHQVIDGELAVKLLTDTSKAIEDVSRV